MAWKGLKEFWRKKKLKKLKELFDEMLTKKGEI